MTSASYFHKILIPMGGNLIEFICERGTPHLYYAAFADGVIPVEPILAEVASANDQGIISNYWLRKELASTTVGDVVPGTELALQSASVV